MELQVIQSTQGRDVGGLAAVRKWFRAKKAGQECKQGRSEGRMSWDVAQDNRDRKHGD